MAKRKPQRAKLSDATVKTPGTHTQCLLCGRIFYDTLVSPCPNCGGLARQWTNSDLHSLERNSERDLI